MRYYKVLEGLVDQPVTKFILSGVGAIWAALQDVVVLEPALLLVCFIVLVLDFYTGIRSSRKKGIRITSFGIRQLGPKVIEYGTVILVFTIMSYGFGRLEGTSWVVELLSVFKHSHYFAYLWVFITEAFSVLENLGFEDTEIYKLLERLKKKIFNSDIK